MRITSKIYPKISRILTLGAIVVSISATRTALAATAKVTTDNTQEASNPVLPTPTISELGTHPDISPHLITESGTQPDGVSVQQWLNQTKPEDPTPQLVNVE